MKRVNRRQVLKLAAAAGAAHALAACGASEGPIGEALDARPLSPGTEPDAGPDAAEPDAATDSLPGPPVHEGPPGPEDLFRHGVASGDPLADAVILWTRLSGIEAEAEVFWEIARDPDFAFRLAVGTVTAGPGRDFTVKVDAAGLIPGRGYWYRFHALGRVSPVGQTRTLAAGALDRARLAVVSCASLGHGWFHTYRELAARADLDLVVHLGDYIYEYGNGEYGSVREYDPPTQCLTLDDYRRRYRQYRSEPWLQAAHARHPFVCVWDDHEFANGAWPEGGTKHDPLVHGPWADRRDAARQAYFEWVPIREQPDGRIFRRFQVGDLIGLMMLDTRMWGRDAPDPERFDDPARTLLGMDQEAWLEEELQRPETHWRLLGQQVMFGHLRFRARDDLPLGVLNFDQWDGYVGARDRLLGAIRRNAVENVVVLSADIHSSWVSELVEDPNDPSQYDPETGEGAVAVEFVATSVTSPALPALQPAILDLLLRANPHIKDQNFRQRGWLQLDVTRERLQGVWWLFEDIRLEAEQTPAVGGVWEVPSGAAKLVRGEAPAE